MRILRILISLIVALIISGCIYDRPNFSEAIYPLGPVNLESVNSEYDDYNSDMNPYATNYFNLTFSTNRKSQGKDFDFISYDCNIYFDEHSGKLQFNTDEIDILFLIYQNTANTEYNEFGPYSRRLDNNNSSVNFEFWYASDITGDLDIYYMKNHDLIVWDEDYDENDSLRSVDILNSDSDDAYPCFLQNETDSTEKIFFTSNRDGQFDIYCTSIIKNRDYFYDTTVVVTKVMELSSEGNDKCPFIYGNSLIFTSDRAGGYGGFDLWYSIYDGQKWSAPKNFGAQINTSSDEYRPIIKKDKYEMWQENEYEFINDLMIFSSNRPGGKGGFDLYYVGINKNLN